MNIHVINRLLGFLVSSFLVLVCIATSVIAQAAPPAQSPEVTALIDRAVIENLMVDYYSAWAIKQRNHPRHLAALLIYSCPQSEHPNQVTGEKDEYLEDKNHQGDGRE
jgi:hypothetical protein